jgi:hypothetical protein
MLKPDLEGSQLIFLMSRSVLARTNNLLHTVRFPGRGRHSSMIHGVIILLAPIVIVFRIISFFILND